MRTYIVYTVTYGPGYGLKTVMIEADALKGGRVEDYFVPGFESYTCEGPITVDGDACDVLDERMVSED